MDTDREMADLKRQCVDLFFDCPRRHEIHCCPFSHIRHLDIVARIDWLRKRSLAELREAVRRHAECEAVRADR